MKIVLKSASEHNLKHIDLAFESNKVTVITGPSGAGKSTLVMDILYSQGQRRYIESFAPYARLFMERFGEADYGQLPTVPPAIAIERAPQARTFRATVATSTEISDYVKLLFYNFSSLYCPYCDIPLTKYTPYSVAEYLLKSFYSQKIDIGFELPEVNSIPNVEDYFLSQGYSRVRDSLGKYLSIDEITLKEPHENYTIIVDRLQLLNEKQSRLIESLEQAFLKGGGRIKIIVSDTVHTFTTELTCSNCGNIFKDNRSHALFSFNTPQGACPICSGFGSVIQIDQDKVIPDPNLSIRDGAIKPWNPDSRSYEIEELFSYCQKVKIPLDTPWKDLSEDDKYKLWNGEKGWWGIKKWFSWLETRSYKMHVRILLSKYRTYYPCPDCNGKRFNSESLKYKINNITIADFSAFTIEKALEWCEQLPEKDEISFIKKNIISRLSSLKQVGLGYITLDRATKTVSGGESQRLSLTLALGSSLSDTLYIFDEPTLGLHPDDIPGVFKAIKELARKGNFVVVVDNHPMILAYADSIIELGPVGGQNGGYITFQGNYKELLEKPDTVSNKGIKNWTQLSSYEKKPKRSNQFIKLNNVSTHNLKNINVCFPLHAFSLITGVSGSGKSSLVEDTLVYGLENKDSDKIPFKISGRELVKEVLFMSQKPWGKTSRGNVATYTGIWDSVRNLFALTPLSKERKYTASIFSFNVAGGRCEHCAGEGEEVIDMQFLANVRINCPVCHGKRFNLDILEVKYHGLNIHDVLELTVEDALEFFKDTQKIYSRLLETNKMGLGYLKLGQSLTTLSSGEGQRLKFLHSIKDINFSSTLIVLDEPSAGLHPVDIIPLIATIKNMVERGATVVAVDHNLLLAPFADWLIDLGPGAGEKGGNVVFEGKPDEIDKSSITANYLAPILKDIRNYWNFTKYACQIEEKHDSVSAVEKPLSIEVLGAREHNLKNVNVNIPRYKLVLITGPSGSGKSTLAFNIIHAESQRRFLESLSPYIRQYLPRFTKPDVDDLIALSPTVALEPRPHQGHGASVATLTEIGHYLRLVYAKAGIQYCPLCHVPISPQSIEQIIQKTEQLLKQQEFQLWIRAVYQRKGTYKQLKEKGEKIGAKKIKIDSNVYDIKDSWKIDRYKEHTIDMMLETLSTKQNNWKENIIKALDIGQGLVILENDSQSFNLSTQMSCPSCGRGFLSLDPRMFSNQSSLGACEECKGRRADENGVECSSCQGTGLNEIARNVYLGSKSYIELLNEPINSLEKELKKISIELDEKQKIISDSILPEIALRVSFLNDVGVGYLTLSRAGNTLSGGEVQRVRLASQLGAGIIGVTYVLDEPTVGLHPYDTKKLTGILQKLRDKGSTVIVVEHDEYLCRNADHVIDLGPSGGSSGGHVVASGSPEELLKTDTLTAKMLNRTKKAISRKRPLDNTTEIILEDAYLHNLKNVTLKIPVNRFVVVAGISGSGKSTLVRNILYRGVRNCLGFKEEKVEGFKQITGFENVKRVIEIDQSPIGKTTRSIPATYLKVWDKIRELFSITPLARMRGFGPGHFSFNRAGGRCEECSGLGLVKLEMNFLPDIYVTCEKCEGKRFKPELLDIKYQNLNVFEVLELTIKDAKEVFSAHSDLVQTFTLIEKLGLDYIKLGQPSPTLSGGEAQRLKLVSEIKELKNRQTLYILDEPTTGLHLSDTEKLINMLQLLVDLGNSLIVIEHHPDIIASADYIYELGPEGGQNGGEIIAQGTPRQLAQKNTPTGLILKEYFLM